MHLYPLLFQPNLHTVVWGGQQLRPYKGLEPSVEPVGESWEVSAVPSSISIVANGEWAGRDLVSVVASAPEAILGQLVSEKYDKKLPLLAKFIDARNDLSIQVHPNDEMARRVHGKMGKSEMWYVIRADEGSRLFAGFKQAITPEEYQQRIADGTIVDVLASHSVKAGDVFYIPAGRVHAICGGIMLAEVQQSSDVTYRIFDYNRPGMDGKPRELHTELAAQALDYHVEKNYRTEYAEPVNRAIQIIDSPYFDVRVMEITAPFHRNLLKYDSFVISMCIEGDCRLRVRSTGDEIVLREGNSTLIPAAIADYDVLPLHGKTRLLDTFIDNMDRSLAGKVTRFLHSSYST
ncbi:MAG: class I mannose-6-phosphate isomerase [Prevotella sp.]|nr:class I mannose-6-phosphate isomerase [Prevotella sp.]MBR1485567.1 class I mannose-6-phosphate isomerase [Prevotella sp.]